VSDDYPISSSKHAAREAPRTTGSTSSGDLEVDKISVSSGNILSLVLHANLWPVALGSKLSARLPWGAFGLVSP